MVPVNRPTFPSGHIRTRVPGSSVALIDGRIAPAPEAASGSSATSRMVAYTSTVSPGLAIARGVSTSSGGGADAAASAITVRQKRSNVDDAGSRNRHASDAPLTMSRPAPTGVSQTIGLVSPAMTVAAVGRRAGATVTAARSVSESPRDSANVAGTPRLDDQAVARVSRSYGPCVE